MIADQDLNQQPANEKKIMDDETDALNQVVAKLSVLGDLIKSADNDPVIIESNTSLGLYIIVGECIDTLKKLGGLED